MGFHEIHFPHRRMSLSLIGNEKSRRFFSISGRSVPEGGALLPRVGFTPELARAVIETQGSKATPKGTLLSEMEQKSLRSEGNLRDFSISDVRWDFLSFYTEFLQRLSVLNRPLQPLQPQK